MNDLINKAHPERLIVFPIGLISVYMEILFVLDSEASKLAKNWDSNFGERPA